MHQNMGQSFANFLDEPPIQVFSYKKWTLGLGCCDKIASGIDELVKMLCDLGQCKVALRGENPCLIQHFKVYEVNSINLNISEGK